jgi:hypothetical protein
MKSDGRKRMNFREYLKYTCKIGVAVLNGRNTVLLPNTTLLVGQLPALLFQINLQQRQLLVRRFRHLIHSLNLNIWAAVMYSIPYGRNPSSAAAAALPTATNPSAAAIANT